MEKYTHINHGTCSTSVEITVEGDMIKHVKINDGCRGNTQGVSRLAENRPIDEVIALCDGIQCRNTIFHITDKNTVKRVVAARVKRTDIRKSYYRVDLRVAGSNHKTAIGHFDNMEERPP